MEEIGKIEQLVLVELVIYDVAVIMTSLVDRFNTDSVVMAIIQ